MKEVVIADEDLADPVIHTYPVFLNATLDSKLALMQFTTHAVQNPFPPAAKAAFAIRHKPKHKLIEVDVPIDTRDNPFYDVLKGQDLAAGINQNTATLLGQKPCPKGIFDRMTYSSTHVPLAEPPHFVACVRNGQVHLSPLADAYQLKPSMAYLDDIERKNKSINKKLADDETAAAMESGIFAGTDVDHQTFAADDAPPDAAKHSSGGALEKAIQVQFRRKETEEEMLSRLKSFAYYNRLVQQEPWQPLAHRHFDDVADVEAAYFADALVCPPAAAAAATCVPFAEDRDAFFDRVLPKISQLSRETVVKDAPGLSMHNLMQLPLAAQIKALLINTKIVTLTRLSELLKVSLGAHAATDAVVLQELEKSAHFLKGRWVLKSELAFPAATCTASSSSTAAAAAAAFREKLSFSRDYLLGLFATAPTAEDAYVQRKALADVAKLPADILQRIFSEIAVYTNASRQQAAANSREKCSGWRLKNGCGSASDVGAAEDAFLRAHYAATHQRQAEALKELFARAKEYFLVAEKTADAAQVPLAVAGKKATR